jgi:hypothetical protein
MQELSLKFLDLISHVPFSGGKGTADLGSSALGLEYQCRPFWIGALSARLLSSPVDI